MVGLLLVLRVLVAGLLHARGARVRGVHKGVCMVLDLQWRGHTQLTV